MIDSGEWTPVRSPKGRLICYIHRERGLLKWRDGEDAALVDLWEILGIIRNAKEKALTHETLP